MATKVKGGAIKEGSIPLSALSNEVKDKIENAGGGADWNAQKGEAGYIENRPFYDNINNKFDINDFEERIETEEEFGETYTYSVYTATIRNFNEFNLAIKIKSFEEYDYYFIKYKEEKDILVLGGGGITIKPSSDNEEIIIEIVDPANFQNLLDNLYYKLYEDYSNDYIKHIKDVFIPNTVLKTTPQTLSDTDKNQALANLGIDPVVWKYIQNPIIIKDGDKAPEDILTGEFDDAEYEYDFSYYKLKDFVCTAMFKYVDYDDVNLDHIYNTLNVNNACVDANLGSVFYVNSQKKWHRYDA